tara:strand:- start:46 stop:339 length:294 start_codon:yes stop_codon:yes gene_type:complete
MLFEQFLIAELKIVFQYIKLNYGILKYFKIYKLNKNDVIIIMRNTQCFDETHEGFIRFTYENHTKDFKPVLKKTKYYRGVKKSYLTIHKKEILIEFE